MRTDRWMGVVGPLLLVLTAAVTGSALAPPDDHSSLVIVFKDGHRQSLAMAEIASIDFKAPPMILYKDGHREKVSADITRIEFDSSTTGAMMPGRAHYVGKWEVFQDGNSGRFFITLDADGSARKTIGSSHGTWTLVDGEARISWDDGWHDAIRKVGGKHEKRAFEPGRSFDDTPSNVSPARNTQPRPI